MSRRNAACVAASAASCRYGNFRWWQSMLGAAITVVETKMKSLAELGIGLSAVFGIFVLALLAELWYIFHWKRLGSSAKLSLDCLRSGTESIKARNAEFVREASLVGSFGGYFSSAEVVVVGGGEEYGADQAPHILFPIKEETKEDLELAITGSSARPISARLRSRTPSDVLTGVAFTSGSSSPAASVDSSFTTPPSSPPTARLSPYAARAVSAYAARAARSPARAEMHVFAAAAGAGGPNIPPPANGRAGRTPLQLLFERSPLLGPAPHMPSPASSLMTSFNASPPPFYHRLSLGALFGQSPTSCVPHSTTQTDANIHEHRQPHR